MQPNHPSEPQQPHNPDPTAALPQPPFAQQQPFSPQPAFSAQPPAGAGYPAPSGEAWPGGGYPPVPPASAAPAPAAWVPERPARVRREVRAPALGIMAAGLLAAVGSFAPWVHVTQSGVSTSLDGLDYGGLMTVVPAFVVMAAGALLYLRTVLGLAVTALACGSAMTVICMLSFYPANWLSEASSALGDTPLGSSSFDAGASWGLWLTFVAALGIVVAGTAAVLRGIWLVPAGSPTADSPAAASWPPPSGAPPAPAG